MTAVDTSGKITWPNWGLPFFAVHSPISKTKLVTKTYHNPQRLPNNLCKAGNKHSFFIFSHRVSEGAHCSSAMYKQVNVKILPAIVRLHL